MRVKMNDTERWMICGQGAQNRQGDGMVTTDTDWPHAVDKHLLDGDLDTPEGILDGQRIDGNISIVGDAMTGEGVDFQIRMIGPDQRRLHPDVPRPEAGTSPVGRAAVKGHPNQRDVQLLRVWDMRQTHKGWNGGEPWMHQRI